MINSTKLLLLLLIAHTASCKAQNKYEKYEKNCFTSNTFITVKTYILSEINHSSSGTKFYLEYPVDTNKVNDGVMRPSKHPENVFDIRFDEKTGQIIFNNKLHFYCFNETTGFVKQKEHKDADVQLANNIFCFLFESYKKAREK